MNKSFSIYILKAYLRRSWIRDTIHLLLLHVVLHVILLFFKSLKKNLSAVNEERTAHSSSV